MKRYQLYIITIIFSLFFMGCAVHTSTNSRYGSIQEQHAVTNQFRSGEINPGYRYFYAGVFNEPDAILGLDSRFAVEGKFWTPIELTSEELRRWITRLDRVREDPETFARRYNFRYQGAYILDPNGRQVGIWYSKKDWGVFEFPEANLIIAHPPKLRPSLGPRFFGRYDD